MRETDDGEIVMTRREYEKWMAAVPASHAASDDGFFSGLFGSSSDDSGPGLLEDMEVRHEGEHVIMDPEVMEFVGAALDVERPNEYDNAVRIKVAGDVAVKDEHIEPASVSTDSLYNDFATATKHTSADRPLVSHDNKDIYVDPVNGDDSNDGTSSNPVATIQEAFDRFPVILRHQYRIHLADGTYTESPFMDPVHLVGSEYDATSPQNAFKIIGNSSTPSNVVIDGNPHIGILQGEADKPVMGDLHLAGTLVAKVGAYKCQNVTFTGTSSSVLTNSNNDTVGVSGHSSPLDLTLENCTFQNNLDVGIDAARGMRVMLTNVDGKLAKYVAALRNGGELVQLNSGTVWGEHGYVDTSFGGGWVDENGERRDGKGAHYYDDFGDGRIQNRMRPSGGGYRDEWDILSGSPSAVDGAASLPAGDTTAQVIQTPFAKYRQTVGTWEFDFQLQADPTSGRLDLVPLRQNSDNYWAVRVSDGGSAQLLKVDSGTATFDVISGTWPDNTNEHTVKVTRASDGTWEVFINGSSLGTATDSFLPRPNRILFDNRFNAEVRIPQVNVRE